MVKQSIRATKKERARKRKEALIIGSVLLVLTVGILIYTFSLQSNITENNEKIARLENQYEDESERASELADEEAFMDSNEFIEKIARERLGLVSPDETIIKPDN